MPPPIIDLTRDDEDVDILERIRQQAPKAPSARPPNNSSAFRSPAQSTSQASSVPKRPKSSFNAPQPTPSGELFDPTNKSTRTKAPTHSPKPHPVHSPIRSSSQTSAVTKTQISSSLNTSRPTPSTQASVVTPKTAGTTLSSDNNIPVSLRNSRNGEKGQNNGESAFGSPLARKQMAECTTPTDSTPRGLTSFERAAKAGNANDVRSHRQLTSGVAERKRNSTSRPDLDSLRKTGLERERRRSLMVNTTSRMAGTPSHKEDTEGSTLDPQLDQITIRHRGTTSFTPPVPGFFYGIPSKTQNARTPSLIDFQSHDRLEKTSTVTDLLKGKPQATAMSKPQTNRALTKRGLQSDETLSNQQSHVDLSTKAITHSSNASTRHDVVDKLANTTRRDAEHHQTLVTLPKIKHQPNADQPTSSTKDLQNAGSPPQKQNLGLSASRKLHRALVDKAIHTLDSPMQSDDGAIDAQSGLNQDSAFPDGFDRGRFPKERRRRGGTKYGTPRVNGFVKSPQLGSSRRFGLVGTHKSKHAVQDRDVWDPSMVRSGSTLDEFVPVIDGSATSTLGVSPTANNNHDSVHPSKATSNENPPNKSLPITLPMSPTKHDQLLEFIYSVLHPQLKKQEARHKERLNGSKSELKYISRNVANKLVNDDLVRFLQENNFSTEKSQRKYIRKNIKYLYRRVVDQTQHPHQDVPAKEQQNRGFWPDVPSKKANLPTQPAINYEAVSGQRLNAPNTQSDRHEGIPLQMLSSHSGRLPDLRLSSVEEDAQTAGRRSKALQLRDKPKIHPTSESSSQLQICPKRSPPTASDAQLEALLAQVALARPSKAMTRKASENIDIDDDDQTKLVEDKYVVKSICDTLHPRATKVVAIESNVVDPASRADRTTSSLLRHRELGSARKIDIGGELKLRTLEKLRPWRKWKGASSDIVSVAWAPDSLMYAVGAAAHTNHEDLEYNRPCNLMLGELSSNQLWELPDHRTMRPTPDRISTGYNSRQETYNACDPVLYQTVGSIAFSANGRQMYTASFDKTLKVWDTANGRRACTQTMDHEAVVVAVDVARDPAVMAIATASQLVSKAIRIYHGTEESIDPVPLELSSSRAEARRDLKIYPERIAWGPTSQTNHLLLAGFSAWEDAERAGEGQLCLWDVHTQQPFKITPASQSVSAAAWHPVSPFFATGGAPGTSALSKSHSTRSVVRVYDPRWLTRCAMEYESPAYEITDITFHPLDSNLVTAGCTDGSSFVWDFRWHDKPLHKLIHGNAIMELDHHRHRERSDTGVMISLWGPQGSLYYTGSSDGLVKAWDVRRHPEDVHVRDVAQVGAAIQNGAFSPDFSHLLVGDADGAIHILSSAPTSSPYTHNSTDEYSGEQVQLVRAADGSGKRLNADEDHAGSEGIDAANELLRTGQLILDPVYGPGKGPGYTGPYVKDDRRYRREDGIPLELKEEFDRQQTFDRYGRINEAVAAEKRYYHAMRKAKLNESKTGTFPPRNEGNLAPTNSKIDHSDMVKEGHLGTKSFGDYMSRAKADNAKSQVAKGRKEHKLSNPRLLKGARDTVISNQRMLKDDHWWPRLGEEEITRAQQRGGGT